jgi:hypothetical protein
MKPGLLILVVITVILSLCSRSIPKVYAMNYDDLYRGRIGMCDSTGRLYQICRVFTENDTFRSHPVYYGVAEVESIVSIKDTMNLRLINGDDTLVITGIELLYAK